MKKIVLVYFGAGADGKPLPKPTVQQFGEADSNNFDVTDESHREQLLSAGGADVAVTSDVVFLQFDGDDLVASEHKAGQVDVKAKKAK